MLKMIGTFSQNDFHFSEFELLKMMNDIQNNLKCLGLLEPYFWKKGEACAVRGSDTMWYRGKVIEVVGGTIRVSDTLMLFLYLNTIALSIMLSINI